MAEVVGLIATITSIITFAGQITGGLYRLSSALKDNGAEVTSLANQTSVFATVLEYLRTTLEKHAANIGFQTMYVINDLAERCDEVLESGEQLYKSLEPLLQQSKLTAKRAFLVVKWILAKPKFMNYRAQIEGFKSSLSLLVQTLLLEVARKTNTDVSEQKVAVHELKQTVDAGIGGLKEDMRAAFGTSGGISANGFQPAVRMIEAAQQMKLLTLGDSEPPATEFDTARNDATFDNMVGEIENRLTTYRGRYDRSDPDGIGPLSLAPYFNYLKTQESVSRHAGNIMRSLRTSTQSETIPQETTRTSHTRSQDAPNPPPQQLQSYASPSPHQRTEPAQAAVASSGSSPQPTNRPGNSSTVLVDETARQFLPPGTSLQTRRQPHHCQDSSCDVKYVERMARLLIETLYPQSTDESVMKYLRSPNQPARPVTISRQLADISLLRALHLTWTKLPNDEIKIQQSITDPEKKAIERRTIELGYEAKLAPREFTFSNPEEIFAQFFKNGGSFGEDDNIFSGSGAQIRR